MNTPTRVDARFFLLVVSGLLLVQTAWALVVPPFRGLDEHDHAYKAAAVALGDWKASHPPSEQGVGDLMVVPAHLVEAAEPVCAWLPYTKSDNCTAVEARGGGLVTVATKSGAYNPAYYWVIGTAARPFDGATALYVMRSVSALLCALLIAWALTLARSWARTAWPAVGTLLAMTPVFLYSTVVAAPNGIELSAALLVWVALLGIARDGPRHPGVRKYVIAAAVASVPLVLVRTLGPLWAVLILATVCVLLGRVDLLRLLRQRDALVAIGAVSVATLVGGVWTLMSGSNQEMGPPTISASPGPGLPAQWALWFLQSIAAFPARDEIAPAAVYAVVGIAWWVFVVVSVRRSTWTDRWALAGVLLVSSAVAIGATLATYSQIGPAWQGRYGYPYAMGFLLICGFALDRWAAARPQSHAWPVWAAATVMVTAGLIGQLDVLSQELRISPLAGDPAWIAPSSAVVVALNLVGLALIAWAFARSKPSRSLDTLRP